MSEDAFDELEKMLASLFGEQMASDAVSALRSSGVDPSSIAQMPGVGDISQLSPAQLLAMRAQFQQMFAASTSEPVNWQMGQELALQQARGDGDPTVTAAVAESTRQALQVADLWLDTATEFMPAPGQREAWSRSAWVERTLPVWKDVCAPVAEAVTAALARTLEKQIQDMPAEMGQAAQQMGALGSIMRTMAGTAFGLQLGRGLSGCPEADVDDGGVVDQIEALDLDRADLPAQGVLQVGDESGLVGDGVVEDDYLVAVAAHERGVIADP